MKSSISQSLTLAAIIERGPLEWGPRFLFRRRWSSCGGDCVDRAVGDCHAPPVKKPWSAFYSTLSGGRFGINRPELNELQSLHQERMLIAPLDGRLEMVVLLDRPFRIGELFPGDRNCYRMHPVRARDLPARAPRP